jgi:hypothetical protein
MGFRINGQIHQWAIGDGGLGLLSPVWRILRGSGSSVDGSCCSGMESGFQWPVSCDVELNDRYPSLLMRALGLRLVPSSPHLTKLVSYEFMNRQLVWNAFTVSVAQWQHHIC